MDLGYVYFYEIKTRFGIMRRYRLCATYYRRLFPVLFVPCHGLLLHFIFRLLSALFFTAWMRWCWIIYKTKRYDFLSFWTRCQTGLVPPPPRLCFGLFFVQSLLRARMIRLNTSAQSIKKLITLIVVWLGISALAASLFPFIVLRFQPRNGQPLKKPLLFSSFELVLGLIWL